MLRSAWEVVQEGYQVCVCVCVSSLTMVDASQGILKYKMFTLMCTAGHSVCIMRKDLMNVVTLCCCKDEVVGSIVVLKW